MVPREIFEKCTVARLGVPCGLTRHPLDGMAKWPPTCYNIGSNHVSNGWLDWICLTTTHVLQGILAVLQK